KYEETKTLVQQVNTHGDITLFDLRKCVSQKNLSLKQVGPVFRAIRLQHEKAIFKRPKGHVVTPGTTKTVESSIQFVLPDALVHKSQTAGWNAIAREQSKSERMPPHDGRHHRSNLRYWNVLSCRYRHHKISAAQKLIKWVESKPDTETHRAITSRVPTMNMYSAFKSKVGETIVQFDDLTKFAGEMWLCDGCVFVAALKMVDVWIRVRDGRIFSDVHVVDPVFLGFKIDADRARMIDTKLCVMSKVAATRAILVSIYIDVDIKHWCGAIIDFGSKFIWIYDPKHRNDYLDDVEAIVLRKLVPLIEKTWTLTIRRSSAWYQDDGHNCGVLVVKWFETFLKVATSTKQGEDITDLTPDHISTADLDECRYNMFQSAFMDIATS
ncbi:Ulp1 protease family C-terminal catalytic domain-containing protein, partial [Phytophthora infestans]